MKVLFALNLFVTFALADMMERLGKAQVNMTKSELDTHIVCAVSIFLVAYVGVLLAYYFRELEMFSVLNIFAGGLMFSAGIIHLLPDAAEKLEDQSLWAFTSFSSAFLFLFLLEKTLHQQHETHKTFIAIIAHKGLAGFALGAAFVRGGLNFRLLNFFGFVFSVISPIGIMIGYLLGVNSGSTVTGILLSLAAGSFIYVALVEVLIPEFSQEVGLKKVSSCLLGWLIFTVLAFWV